MGVDHRRIFAVALGLAFVVIAVAALYLGLRANFDPTIGPARLLYAFEAVITLVVVLVLLPIFAGRNLILDLTVEGGIANRRRHHADQRSQVLGLS